MSSAAWEAVVSPHCQRSLVCALYDPRPGVRIVFLKKRNNYLQPRLITDDSAGGDQVLKKVLVTKILPKGKGCVAEHLTL